MLAVLEWLCFGTDSGYWNSRVTATSCHQPSTLLWQCSPKMWRHKSQLSRVTRRDHVLSCSGVGWIFPDLDQLLHVLCMTDKFSSSKYWAGGHRVACSTVPWHLSCRHRVYNEGHTHRLHPHPRTFSYWSTRNGETLLHFSQYPILTERSMVHHLLQPT